MRNSPTAVKTRFMGLDTLTDKCRLPHPKVSSTTSCVPPALVVLHITTGFCHRRYRVNWHYFHEYNTHICSYAPYKSVRMQTINFWKRVRSQSTHKVPKRRRLAPSWDVVDDRPPHQLVHGGFQTDFCDWWSRHLLWIFPDIKVTGLHWWPINIGSDNGLVPSGNMPLPELMLIQISVAIWCH